MFLGRFFLRRKAYDLHNELQLYMAKFSRLSDKDKHAVKSIAGTLAINFMDQAGYSNWLSFLGVSRPNRERLLKVINDGIKYALDDQDILAVQGYHFIRMNVEASLLVSKGIVYAFPIEDVTTKTIQQYIVQINSGDLDNIVARK